MSLRKIRKKIQTVGACRRFPHTNHIPAWKAVAAAIGESQEQRILVQDLRPLPESLEWRLGQSYLRRSGNAAFIIDPEPVPFLINNDGMQSMRAAEILIAALDAAEAQGKRTTEIVTLELGIGVGLFARFFLDHFRQLCREAGKDYYERLHYILG